MKKIQASIVIITIISTLMVGFFRLLDAVERGPELMKEKIELPEPKYDSSTSIEQALLARRSVRKYKDEPLTLTEVSQLLWAAQGITESRRRYRTAPSAGALYPLEVYAVMNNVERITQGVYKYNPHKHELEKVKQGNVNDELTDAALRQTWISESAFVIVFSAVYKRTTKKYGNRGIRYVHMEAGHAAQNVCLQAISLNLGTVVVAAFRDEKVKKILNMPNEEQPLYIIPVGKI